MRGAFWRDPAFCHPNAGLLQKVPFSYTFLIGLGVVQGYTSAGAVLRPGTVSRVLHGCAGDVAPLGWTLLVFSDTLGDC